MPKFKYIEDSVHKELIQEGLSMKKSKFGKRYCPCKVENIDENVCPCVEYKTTDHCHCGLFTE